MNWQDTPVRFSDSGIDVDITDKKQLVQYIEKNDRLVLGHGKQRVTLNLAGNMPNQDTKQPAGIGT